MARFGKLEMRGMAISRGVTMLACALVLWAGSAAIACADSNDAAVAAIKQAWLNYAAFVESGDTAGWLSQYDAEGIQMRPDNPARGRPELDQFVVKSWKARMDAFDTKMSVTPLEITVAGPWAYSRGFYTQDMTAKATKKTTHFEGKFLTIFRMQSDGTWKIYRDCFNSNLPPAN
jgi:ketosteroid isomerase-like protein